MLLRNRNVPDSQSLNNIKKYIHFINIFENREKFIIYILKELKINLEIITMIIIKFIWSHWKWSDRFMEWTEKWYDWSIDPDYNVKYKFTREDYTHAIIFDNNTPSNLKAPKENVIGLMFEPKMNVNFNTDYMKTHVKKFYCRYKKSWRTICRKMAFFTMFNAM